MRGGQVLVDGAVETAAAAKSAADRKFSRPTNPNEWSNPHGRKTRRIPRSPVRRRAARVDLGRLHELENLNSAPVPADAKELSAWFKTFAETLARHFSLESRPVSPARARPAGFGGLVLTLQKQHGLILAHRRMARLSLAFAGQYPMIKDVLPRFAP